MLRSRMLFSIPSFLLFTAVAAAQVPAGGRAGRGNVLDGVRGTVTYGALALPGAKVRLINRQTLEEFESQTDLDGGFSFNSQPPGTYYLIVVGSLDAPALLRTRTVEIPGGQNVEIDLEPPPVSIGRGGRGGGGAGGGAAAASGDAGGAPGGRGGAGPKPRLTGRGFLIRKFNEAPVYGLYSYLLFGSSPDDSSNTRYKAALAAFMQVIRDIEGLEASGLSRRLLNITYIPVKQAIKNSDDTDEVLTNYDSDRSQALLSRIPGGLRTGGPYIVSTLQPLSRSAPDKFLYQDLTAVPTSVIVPWINEFRIQASRGDFWQDSTVDKLVLTLRTRIEQVADAIPDAKSAVKEWKSFLTTVITWSATPPPPSHPGGGKN